MGARGPRGCVTEQGWCGAGGAVVRGAGQGRGARGRMQWDLTREHELTARGYRMHPTHRRRVDGHRNHSMDDAIEELLDLGLLTNAIAATIFLATAFVASWVYDGKEWWMCDGETKIWTTVSAQDKLDGKMRK